MNEFLVQQVSSLNNTLKVPTFVCMGPIQHCMKFLRSQVHQGKLWLAQLHPITIEHIKDMIGLSMGRPKVQMTFQSHKSVDIASIKTKLVKKIYQILACQIMRKQKKGECTFDLLSESNAYVQGKHLN